MDESQSLLDNSAYMHQLHLRGFGAFQVHFDEIRLLRLLLSGGCQLLTACGKRRGATPGSQIHPQAPPYKMIEYHWRNI
jgi:hypothetical protein